MVKTTLRTCLILIHTCLGILGFSQSIEGIVKTELYRQWSDGLLPASDIEFIKINQYSDNATGITYAYVQQYVHDVPIEHAIANFTSKKGILTSSNTSRLVRNVLHQILDEQPQISAFDATTSALIQSGNKTYLRAKPQLEQQLSSTEYIFKKTEGILSNIPTQLWYRLEDDGHLKLYWKVGVFESDGKYWQNYIDAQTGNIALRTNQTKSCFPVYHRPSKNLMPALPYAPSAAPQYRVVPVPLTALNEGSSAFVSDPSDKIASPLGWHSDGINTYTITQGNNVHAFADPDSNYIASHDEPNGTSALSFDYIYNPTGTIAQNKNAAVTNLFYMNNVMHDFAYNYGFTEPAGNFQNKNFTGTGKGNDAVIALDQYGYNYRSIRNNADYYTPPDGGNGIMRMFVWNVSGAKLLKVIDPINRLKGFSTSTADFGAVVNSTAVSGKLVVVSDGTANSSQGCNTLINGADVKGKIVLIDRGTCFFHEKACNAQAAGAIGVIICNYDDTPLSLGAVSPPPCNVTIPVISIGATDCKYLKSNIQSVTVSIQAPSTANSAERDGSFDNTIVSHEYTHGISTRLTGGPGNQSSCLDNAEQMGEGWSDFVALAVTAKPQDNGNTLRNIGTYVLQEDINDVGIRQYPYTTNMAVNPQTYEDTYTAEVHDLGAVWTAMLWDLYWKLTDAYGWDPDLYKGKGGNNKAIHLVMEGLKLQPCSPGFVDGRDAILKADQLLYNGEDQCLIWEAFARRGLGYSASQGSSNNQSDGVQAFDVPPSCVPTIKINKLMTPFIHAGDDIQVKLYIRNDTKAEAHHIKIVDTIPYGAIYADNSSTLPVTVTNNLIIFNQAALYPGDSIVFNYILHSSTQLASTTLFIDSMESTQGNYAIASLLGSGIWRSTTTAAHSGKKSWFVPDQSVANDQELNITIPGDFSKIKQPVFRFYHRYKIQAAFDGGIVSASTDGGVTWNDLGNSIFRNPYNGPISYNALPLVKQRGFYGDSKTFIPTYIELNKISNSASVQFQFRFGSDDAIGGTGWYIDDLELMDMFNYNSHACLSYDGGTAICAEAPAKGTIVETQSIITANKDVSTSFINLHLAPNPANEQLNIHLQLKKPGDVSGTVYSIDGKLQKTFKFYATSINSKYTLQSSDLSVGMYILTLKSGNMVGQEKFIIQR